MPSRGSTSRCPPTTGALGVDAQGERLGRADVGPAQVLGQGRHVGQSLGEPLVGRCRGVEEVVAHLERCWVLVAEREHERTALGEHRLGVGPVVDVGHDPARPRAQGLLPALHVVGPRAHRVGRHRGGPDVVAEVPHGHRVASLAVGRGEHDRGADVDRVGQHERLDGQWFAGDHLRREPPAVEARTDFQHRDPSDHGDTLVARRRSAPCSPARRSRWLSSYAHGHGPVVGVTTPARRKEPA